jgi:hypothetical protein
MEDIHFNFYSRLICVKRHAKDTERGVKEAERHAKDTERHTKEVSAKSPSG